MTNHSNPTPSVLVRTRPCIMCGQPGSILVPADGFDAWQAGTFAQIAFPTLSADERELLITGTHPACWGEMFAEEEEA